MMHREVQALVDQLNSEAGKAAEQAQYELDHDDPDGAAVAWAVLAVERRLAWLGVVLAPSPSRLSEPDWEPRRPATPPTFDRDRPTGTGQAP